MQRVIASSGVNPVSQLDWSSHISPEIVAEAILWLCTDAAREVPNLPHPTTQSSAEPALQPESPGATDTLHLP